MENNLLNITSVPISIEINITNGRYNAPDDAKPQMEVSKTNGGYKIDAQPAKIKIDSYGARSSMGYGEYNNNDFSKTEAQKGIKVAYEATATIVNEGDMLARGQSPAEIARQNLRAGANIQTIMEFLPKQGADVTFDKGKLNINYELGNTDIDWKNLEVSKLEFTPGTIEFIVKERPRVEIEYRGAPIYVPASSAPDYDVTPMLNTKG